MTTEPTIATANENATEETPDFRHKPKLWNGSRTSAQADGTRPGSSPVRDFRSFPKISVQADTSKQPASVASRPNDHRTTSEH